MIQLIQVSKVYNQGKRNENIVLDRVNLTIQSGEMLAIMGKSGAGKTTLINIIGALDRSTSGQVLFQDMDISKLKEEKMAQFRADHVGIVLQNFALLQKETVASNVQLPMYFTKKKPTDCLPLKKVLSMCQIPNFEKRKIKELSGGEMQRVAIARALFTNPDLLIADEPTGALDSETSMQILKLFQELNRLGKTILIVTHDHEVAKSCQKIILIQDGKIIK